MSITPDLNTIEREYSDGLDAVVIRRYTGGITGGRTLDMTDFPDESIRAGHIIICEDTTDTYKPLPVKDGKYQSLPEGTALVGVVVASKPKAKPFVAIMNVGEVNDVASPYPIDDTLRKALRDALPGLIFTHD